MGSSEITRYVNMATRRMWWIIIPFLLALLGGFAYALKTPKIYQAQTLILVQPQKVPEDFVRTIVSATVEDRLSTISQQVTSRTNLEKIIKEHGLYDSSDEQVFMDDKVALLRRMIKIDVNYGGRGRGTESFTIAFRGKDPKMVMEVTNALASNFISENLKIRESQAIGTSAFISDELASVEKRLLAKEEELKKYRQRYMGGLPEQLQTNLTILERLQGQLDQLLDSLRDAENRRIVVQTQISAQETARAEPLIGPTSDGGTPRDIASLKNELATLEAKYTANHPDVIRLKETIAGLEGQRLKDETGSSPPEAFVYSVDQELKRQLQDISIEIDTLKAEIKKVQSQTKWYQKKVEETPKREQELLSLKRDYGNLRELYNSLLNRKLEAQIAVSMEKKQKGEQFRVIDPAKIPTRPVEPDLRRILLLTLAVGLGLGGGLAFLTEMMDTSYKTPEEVEKDLKLPVLVSMPIKYTEKEIKIKRLKRLLALVSVGLAFALSVTGIFLALKGVDASLAYLRKILSAI
ncbi:MAG: XrtA system polysaccharide chain length determinant [Thermodesulfobacteriota bacterium]|nr:XrtA system polysaccharide chain length determinant [Thermodesulfobacteriota bacterium]